MNFMSFDQEEGGDSTKATFVMQMTDKSLKRLSVNLADSND